MILDIDQIQSEFEDISIETGFGQIAAIYWTQVDSTNHPTLTDIQEAIEDIINISKEAIPKFEELLKKNKENR